MPKNPNPPAKDAIKRRINRPSGDHLSLSEQAQGRLNIQNRDAMPGTAFNTRHSGPDNTARASKGDHIGLSERGQGSLLDQNAKGKKYNPSGRGSKSLANAIRRRLS